MRAILKHAVLAAALGAAAAPAALAQTRPATGVNFYGVPGLVDMPSAAMQPDGELTFSAHAFDNGTGRGALTFQILPWVQGVFRYATLPDFEQRRGGVGSPLERTYDRSFDLRFRLLSEGPRRPAVVLGLQDLGGTGIYGAEYLVATKTFDRLTVTGGIGWGRLGSEGGFSNPLRVFGDRFETRPAGFAGTGGQFEVGDWFRGPAALFGGVTYAATDRLTLKAEYSSDAYVRETARGIVERDTSVNVGLDYAVSDALTVSAALRHGTDVGLGLTYAINPKRSQAGSGTEGAPEPVLVRPPRSSDPTLYGTEWVADPASGPIVVGSLERTMRAAGLELVAYQISGTRAQARFVNRTWESEAQAIGRAARAMSRSLPASIETFEIVPVADEGIASAAVVLRRSDVEALENRPDGAAEILAVAGIVDSARLDDAGLTYLDGAYPRFEWAIGPYFATSSFDPENPIRVDAGLQVSAEYEPTPGLLFSGAVRQKVIGNRDDASPGGPSALPRVRTDTPLFLREQDDLHVPYLMAEYFFRPAPDLYGRVSGGLLETQYGGLSAELLWKPAEGPLALGLEVNRVRQREFEGGLGFRDLEATTAFASAYYEHGNGFQSTVHVGQYLAGDRGATYQLTRRFANGWEVGAFATKTNVSSAEFGEGSFDKGIILRAPLSFFTGQPSPGAGTTVIRPIQRDGGARLNVRNRLYGVVADTGGRRLTEDWGRFWR